MIVSGEFRRRYRTAALALALAITPLAVNASDSSAARQQNEQIGEATTTAEAFQFGVIGHAFKGKSDEPVLKQALKATSQADLAFVVANGIKASTEPCSDRLFAQRKALLNDSVQPLIVSLAASDWSACRNSLGRSAAIDRLNRLRDMFFSDSQSLGERKIALSRLSSTASFRSYSENAHWEYGGVLFATINLPSNNNHYLTEAGRNSEFEDRLVANRVWLKRLFMLAQRKKLAGIVLFSDGDVGVQTEERSSLLPSFSTRQDGFAGPRRQIKTLAQKFSGQVLLIDTQAASTENGAAKAPSSGARGKEAVPAIDWHGNLGHVSVYAGWIAIQVAGPAAPAALPAKPEHTPLFSVSSARTLPQ
jgi:hypothetical protein